MAKHRFGAIALIFAAAACLSASAARGDEVFILATPVQAAEVRLQAVAIAEGDDNPQQAALRAQFEPLLKIELSFANRVCRWTAEERKEAVRAATAWLAQFVRDHAKDNRLLNRGMVLFAGNMPAGMANQNLPAEKELAEALQQKMTAGQRKAYSDERRERDDFVADAVIENLVALMDQRLELTPDQRRKISESLRENWSDEWAPPLQVFVQMSDYIPAFPEEHVLPHLRPEQRVVWQGVQKISARGVVFARGMFGGDVQPIDDVNLAEGP